MTAADLSAEVAQHVHALARDGGWLDTLAELAHHRSTRPRQPGRSRKISGSPAPWVNVDASGALDYLSGATRELERTLREVTEITLVHPRGLSLGATKRSMLSLCALADRAAELEGEHWLAEVLHHVSRWHSKVRQLADVGLQDTWTRPPREPGQPEPQCPLCGQASLRVSRERGEIACANPECVDATTGRPPVWDVVETIGRESS